MAQILNCKRKVVSFVESMLEPVITIDQLMAGCEIICQRDFDDINNERFLVNLCGYPPCPNKITKEWKQQYHISLKERRVFNVEQRKLFCSTKCFDLSTKFKQDNLHEQPMWMRLDDIKVGPNFEIQTSNH